MVITSSSFFTVLKKRITEFGQICICFACFFLPLSTSLLALFSSLALLSWILSGNFLQLPGILKKYPVSLIALLFFLFMILAISYSPAELDEAVYTLKKYRELLLFPVMISMLSLSEKHRELAENSFLTGCIVLMAISYGMVFDILPEDRYGHSIIFHITHNFFMAVLAFWSLHRIFQSKLYHYLWVFLFVAATVNLFYFAPGRTGMLIYICLILLFLVQKLTFKKNVAGLLLLGLLLSIFYYTSNNFHSRVYQMVHEIEKYEPGKSRSSIGQRFDWWTTSITLIKEKPLLGHGTGSYKYVQKSITAKTKITETNNPHNEYLFIGVQFGLLGLFFFISMFILQFIHSMSLPANKRMLLHGVMIAMMSGCFINSFLFDSMQGHFFLLLTAALITADNKASSLKF